MLKLWPKDHTLSSKVVENSEDFRRSEIGFLTKTITMTKGIQWKKEEGCGIKMELSMAFQQDMIKSE